MALPAVTGQPIAASDINAKAEIKSWNGAAFVSGGAIYTGPTTVTLPGDAPAGSVLLYTEL